jgi:hypothetical protein
MAQIKRSDYFIFAGLIAVILLSAIWKIILLSQDLFPFNSDEAIVGLMARHILNGERPIFFYGQAYMGSLDAFLVAAVFRLLGESVQSIRFVQILLYMGVLATTFWLANLVLKSRLAGLMAVLLLAIPTVNMTLYTTVSLGGYGEALLIGNLVLCVGFLFIEQLRKGSRLWIQYLLLIGWGILAGLGLWSNGLTLVYSVPMGIYMVVTIYRSAKISGIIGKYACLIVGGLIGAGPWIIFAVQNTPGRLINELFGSAVAVEGGSWFSQVFTHLLNFILLGIPVTLGFRPPWSVTWLILPMIPFVAALWFLVIRFGFHKKNRMNTPVRSARIVIAWVGFGLIFLFIFTHFGVDPSGRYFLPISIILAVFAGDFLLKDVPRIWWRVGIIAFIMGYQLFGTIQSIQITSGLTTQFDVTTIVDHRYDNELIDFLKENRETRGYTNYWVAYPLAFLSNEDLIFTPRLPYHLDLRYTSRDDRYAPYSTEVENSKRTALITAKNSALDSEIRQLLLRKKITWQEKVIGDYRVFYRLSKPIREGDLNFTPQP